MEKCCPRQLRTITSSQSCTKICVTALSHTSPSSVSTDTIHGVPPTIGTCHTGSSKWYQHPCCLSYLQTQLQHTWSANETWPLYFNYLRAEQHVRILFFTNADAEEEVPRETSLEFANNGNASIMWCYVQFCPMRRRILEQSWAFSGPLLSYDVVEFPRSSRVQV